MPLDYKFDPVTGDLVRDGKGGYVLVASAETAMQEQVRHHYRAWWGAPEQGSRLHDLRGFGAGPAAQRGAQEEARRALHELEKAGRIDTITVTSEQPKQGRVHIAATARDTSTGHPIRITAKPGA